ncbi:unnamed protein product, partial [Menidia menidia]
VEAQKATQEFQRSVEILRAAKETIALAEERLLEEDSRQFDSAWQEMLNHATQRVMEAEQARTQSEAEHRKTATNYNVCISQMRALEKKLKRSINKSRPYFELKAKYYLQLEQLKRQVDERQAKLVVAKAEYRAALRNLESISEEIHAQRRSVAMGTRERGVGAEGDEDNEDIANFKMESDGLSSEYGRDLRVMEAEQARTQSEAEHRKTATNYNVCISQMRALEKKLKRSINKSRPYFELKAKYYLQLEQLKRQVDERQAKLVVAKAEYRAALRNLESISEEIHAQRRSVAMGTRERGVGAEGDEDNEDIANFKMESDGLSSEYGRDLRVNGDRAEGAEDSLESGLNRLTMTVTKKPEESDPDPRVPEREDCPPASTSTSTSTALLVNSV